MTDRRRFGFWTLTAVVVANMIGAGVFTTSGYSLAALQTPGRVLLAWGVGGIIALLGAISYGQLSRVLPESGGEYVYLSRAAHPFLGLIAGWVSLFAGFTGAIAFAALVFETYAVPESIRPPWLPERGVAIGLIWVAAILHGWQLKVGTLVQNGVVLMKLLLLVLFLVLSVMTFARGEWAGGSLPNAAPFDWKLVPNFATSLIYISLSYAGFNAAVYLSEEAVEGNRVIPKSLLAGTLMTSVIYLAINAVFLCAPSPEKIAGEKEIAAIAAEAVGGERLALLVRGVIALALLTSVTSMMLAAPRVYAKMAADRLLPSWLRFTGEVPRGAVIFQATLASVITCTSTVRDLLFYLGLTLSLCSAASVACLFSPTLRPHVQGRWVLVVAGGYILLTLSVAGAMIWHDPRHWWGGVAALVVGTLLYGVRLWWTRSCEAHNQDNPNCGRFDA